MMNAKTLPDQYARLVAPADKERLGIKTAMDRINANEAKCERQLQGQIVNILRLRGIEVLWHRTDKKSAATVGWPDLTFATSDHTPCCWEIKLPLGKLSPAQETMRDKLAINGWSWRLIRSVDEALLELRNLGVQ
jgi:hypothetical protein